jgi:hypothetical protein
VTPMNLGWESWAARLSDHELSAQLRLPASWRSERGTATLRTEFRRRVERRDRRDLDWQGLANVDPGGPGRRSVILWRRLGVARAGGASTARRSGPMPYPIVFVIETTIDELIARGDEFSDVFHEASFGGQLDEHTLVPVDSAQLCANRFEDWLNQPFKVK